MLLLRDSLIHSDKIPPPPGVTVAARRTANDSNDEVQYGERVAYVIVSGAPGTKLLERAYDPKEVLEDP
jgi:DNA polymerase zeta